MKDTLDTLSSFFVTCKKKDTLESDPSNSSPIEQVHGFYINVSPSRRCKYNLYEYLKVF